MAEWACAPRAPDAVAERRPSTSTRQRRSSKLSMKPPAPAEWDPLSAEEQGVAQAHRKRFGEKRFATIAADLLVCFIRGYAEEKNWAETSHELLSKALTWRESVGADAVLAQPPEGLSLIHI